MEEKSRKKPLALEMSKSDGSQEVFNIKFERSNPPIKNQFLTRKGNY
jgi:hypothetical protein